MNVDKNPVLSPKKQRPLQTVLKRKPELLAKLKQKPSGNEPKVTKVEVTKQEEEKKPAPLPIPVEPPLQGGHYALNDRMTKMVETELRDIMIKVWQELPDNPVDEAEALVVDKLRNAAGDDLRNVLGLNITKRLLNVHNPLYVKVQFSGKPEKHQLGDFLKRYNFIAFKRIEKAVNMFAAQVKTISDFDKICSEKDVRCGEVKVTVNPIYKFTKCPPNLVTSFYHGDDTASDETADINEKDDKLEAKTNKEKPSKGDESAPAKDNVNKDVSGTKVEKTVNKTEGNIAVSKPAATVNKGVVQKPAASATKVDNQKPAAIATKVDNQKPAANKANNEKPVAKTDTKVSVEKKQLENNAKAVNKPTVTNKTVNKTVPPTKTTVAKPVDNKPVKKTIPNINNAGKKPTPAQVKSNKVYIKNETDKVESDNDELDDQAILALMSEGIILDECSGSDNE